MKRRTGYPKSCMDFMPGAEKLYRFQTAIQNNCRFPKTCPIFSQVFQKLYDFHAGSPEIATYETLGPSPCFIPVFHPPCFTVYRRPGKTIGQILWLYPVQKQR